ncbi:MAG: aldehyde dehydrogenase family protein [Ignavibacteriales bacterium]|nr:aldehyde dehydrogenase family protein [Ignavibacteriales bacterium]
MPFDKDLQSIQESRDLARRAKAAQSEFKEFTQEQVDKIVKTAADAAYEASERLAKLASEETGFGNWKDKVLKNQFGSRNVWESIKDMKSVGVIGTEANGKVLLVAEPMGVVAALIPSTNPTSTTMFKALISMKCRNAMVAAPHPRAVKCTHETLDVLRDAAVSAGAPKDLLLGVTIPSLAGTSELMSDENVGVILATGSNPMVRAAYSSGKPAYGVGSGNVPAFIERTADYKKAVADIIAGTTFDYGTLCSSEQAIIADRPLRDKVIAEAKAQGAYFVSAEEKKALERTMFPGGKLNPDIVGQAAARIATMAGFDVPEGTRVLVAECEKVGKDEPLSAEKLSPTLAFYTADGWLEGCRRSIELLKFGGVGHTMAIHSNDEAVIMKFALEKPAFRVVVNSLSSLGAVGYTTALTPSLTLGPGTIGGSIVSENVSAKHLMNIKRVAFETNPINRGTSLNQTSGSGVGSDFIREIEERLRARAGNVFSDARPFQPRESGARESGARKSSGDGVKSGGITYGSGVSEKEIEKIINEFRSPKR